MRFGLLAPLILVSLTQFDPFTASVGGKVAPDSATEIRIDLPGTMHRHNVSSRGQGCCTHTSVHHAALWQNVPVLQEFPKWVQAKRLPGGTWPGEMAKRIKAICQEKGMPEPHWMQVEGGKETLELIRAALASGRFPCVTYSFSPTGRYGGGRISHMVNVSHLDDKWAAVLDNNYPGDTKYEWMSVADFLKTYTGGRNGWTLILLDAGPPPLPWN